MAVSAGDALALSVALAPGSAETYVAADGSTTTELITTSWFATAGNLSVQKTSEMQPETVLHLDQRLPASGATIDLGPSAATTVVGRTMRTARCRFDETKKE